MFLLGKKGKEKGQGKTNDQGDNKGGAAKDDQKDIYDEITEKIYPADNYVYNGFYKDKIDEITTESYSTYSPPYDVTRPSSDQWSFWETQSTTRRPPPTFDSSNIWPEYSKVVNDAGDRCTSPLYVDDLRYYYDEGAASVAEADMAKLKERYGIEFTFVNTTEPASLHAISFSNRCHKSA